MAAVEAVPAYLRVPTLPVLPTRYRARLLSGRCLKAAALPSRKHNHALRRPSGRDPMSTRHPLCGERVCDLKPNR